MANNNEIIVKVGKKSKLKFSHSSVYRAITANELIRISDIHSDCNIVIIENIEENEQEAIRQFAVDFKNRSSKNTILFFLPEDDDITSGIADEFSYEIVMTLADLYNKLYKTYDINVSTFMSDKKRISSENIEESMPEGITDIFGEMADNNSLDIEDSSNEDKEENNIEVEDGINIAEDNTSIEDKKRLTEEKVETEPKQVETEPKQVENNIENQFNQDEIETKQTEFISEQTTENNTEDISNDALDKISSLQMQLKDAKYDYNIILKDMKAANERIVALEDVVRVVKDEKEAMIKRYNSLVEQDGVIEDPISLAEYEEIKDKLNSAENKVKDLTSNLEKSKEALNEKLEIIENKNKHIEELIGSIETLKNSLKELNDSIESGEIHKDIINEYNEKLQGAEDKSKKLQDMISSLTDEKNSLTNRLSNETEQLKKEAEEIDYELTKVKEDKERIELEKQELEDKLSDIQKTVEKQTSEIKMLKENAISKADEVGELNKQLKNTNTKLDKQLTEWKAKYKKKEEQYNSLVSSYGMSEDGASVLKETNKSLETLIKNLQEQLSLKSDEINKLKDKERENRNSLNNYKSQCKQLQDTLKNLSSGVNTNYTTVGSITNNLQIKNIKYNGQAEILTVFGSGSFGITTTAMSLAYKLSITSKVLYIDFDMITPKADAWFNKLPLCKNVPGINLQDRRMTGLGIFYEKGMRFFEDNFINIVNHCDKTRGGKIDYLSGVYYRVDDNKIASADYVGLFNFLSSHYNYIVVDMGKLGCNSLTDKLIKNISDIATKNIAVTTIDNFDVRNFKTKLTDNKININNVAWLLNMCESTIVDDKIKRIVHPAKYGLLIKDAIMQGKRERFTHTKINKDRLELFINSVVFSS